MFDNLYFLSINFHIKYKMFLIFGKKMINGRSLNMGNQNHLVFLAAFFWTFWAALS